MPKLPRRIKTKATPAMKKKIASKKMSVEELKQKMNRAEQKLFSTMRYNPELTTKQLLNKLEYTRKDKKLKSFIVKNLGDIKVKNLKVKYLDFLISLYTTDKKIMTQTRDRIRDFYEKRELKIAKERIKLAHTYKDKPKFKTNIKEIFTSSFIKKYKDVKLNDIRLDSIDLKNKNINTSFFKKLQNNFGNLTTRGFLETIEHSKKILK